MYGSRKIPLEGGESAQVTYLKNINAFWKNTANPGYTLVSAGEEHRKHSVLWFWQVDLTQHSRNWELDIPVTGRWI